MITFDFDYYRPSTIDEAVNTYKQLTVQGCKPTFYAGGTELICRARLNQTVFGAVIDIKEIPECNVLEIINGDLIIGSAITLTKISDSGIFPLLGEVCKATADHTARDKITLGGNICGDTPYKETILPFLISDSIAVIAGTNGIRKVPINTAFNERLLLDQGELLVQIITAQSYTTESYISRKRTKLGKPDYPLVTLAAIKANEEVRVALSGVCAYPFRSKLVEDIINDKNYPTNNRIDKAVNSLPGLIIDDIQGCAKYREYVLTNILSDTLTTFE